MDHPQRRGSSQYQEYAKLPIVPLVVTPQNEGIPDSTPIIERLESQFPSPRFIHRNRLRLLFPRCSKSSATNGATNGCSIIDGRGRWNQLTPPAASPAR